MKTTTLALAALLLASAAAAQTPDYPNRPVKLVAPFAPGGPVDVVARVLAEVRERLAALGFEPIASTPGEFADRIKWEIDKWAKVIRAADIKAQ